MGTEEDELYAAFNEQEKKRSKEKEGSRKEGSLKKMFGGGKKEPEWKKYAKPLQTKSDDYTRESKYSHSESSIDNSKIGQYINNSRTGKYINDSTLGQYIGSGVTGIVEAPSKYLEKARLDYENGKISEKTFKEAYRESKKQSALTRGVNAEQRDYQHKVGKANEKEDREKKLKEIDVKAKETYAIERAKTSGRLAAQDSRNEAREILKQAQLERQQLAQQYAQQYATPQSRRPVQFWSKEGAAAVDPLGIYSLGQYRPQQNQQQQNQFRQPQQTQFRQQAPQQQLQPAPNMDFMNFLLGGQENPHSGKSRKKVYNFFKGVYE